MISLKRAGPPLMGNATTHRGRNPNVAKGGILECREPLAMEDWELPPLCFLSTVGITQTITTKKGKTLGKSRQRGKEEKRCTFEDWQL